jgi:hypothetical protein
MNATHREEFGLRKAALFLLTPVMAVQLSGCIKVVSTNPTNGVACVLHIVT